MKIRPEPAPCVVCEKKIVAGQLYVVAGPQHIYCGVPTGLVDVVRVTS